jgi:hypothetical protein
MMRAGSSKRRRLRRAKASRQVRFLESVFGQFDDRWPKCSDLQHFFESACLEFDISWDLKRLSRKLGFVDDDRMVVTVRGLDLVTPAYGLLDDFLEVLRAVVERKRTAPSPAAASFRIEQLGEDLPFSQHRVRRAIVVMEGEGLLSPSPSNPHLMEIAPGIGRFGGARSVAEYLGLQQGALREQRRGRGWWCRAAGFLGPRAPKVVENVAVRLATIAVVGVAGVALFGTLDVLGLSSGGGPRAPHGGAGCVTGNSVARNQPRILRAPRPRC